MKNDRLALYPLDENGFVTQYLYSGRKESDVVDDHRDNDQLRYENYLRSKIASHSPMTFPEKVVIGEDSPLGMPWQYHYSHANGFLQLSTFYLELARVDVLAVTELYVEEDITVDVSIYSCAALDVWLNGQLRTGIERPVYKPLQQSKVTWTLKKGRNRVGVRMETLGVRDTRIDLGIKIHSHQDKVFCTLPAESGSESFEHVAGILNETLLDQGVLRYPESLPEGSQITYKTGHYDFRSKEKNEVIEAVGGQPSTDLQAYGELRLTIPIQTPAGTWYLGRNFEQIDLQKPVYKTYETDNHRQGFYKSLGEIKSLTRGANDGFAMYPLLARYFFGRRDASDVMELDTTLEQINRRMDCADFMTCALVRFLNHYDLNTQQEKTLKVTMLSFRYWMDEEGQDGMCFWSENHSLMFYQTGYFFGLMYPEDVFTRSGLRGKDLAAKSKRLIEEWLKDVLETGFDEFNSGVYTPITFAAILNLVDFAEKEISQMAKDACDLLVRAVALHCFKGVVISPQGRIYRDVLYPAKQSIQSLVHFMDGKAPYVYSEWLISLATSGYELPDDVYELMTRTGHHIYATSNAVIELYKTEDYMVTSVQSPKKSGDSRVWERDDSDSSSHMYTKTLNERFHGTMNFRPGVLGYQQHLWYAALDSDLVVFANHPGGTCEDMPQVRPGYWYGNNVTPAIRQENNSLGVIYQMSEDNPIQFVHLYWDQAGFSQELKSGHWLYGRKGDSYIGVWSSGDLVDFNDVLHNCEKRCYGIDTAFVCVCGSKSENESFEAFMNQCEAMAVTYADSRLTWADHSLVYEAYSDSTQYVD